MPHFRQNFLLSLTLIALTSYPVAGQEDSGWRISPEQINVQRGEERPLQILDNSAQELRGARWSVDDPALADIREEDGRAVVRAKAAGTVRVSASLRGEKRFREIKIWPADQPLPPETTAWGTHPIGRELGDIPAVPNPDGPHVYSLEQTASGSTYLRAIGEDGIQEWSWLMPEATYDVELVCGDWLGGALISANRTDSYTLYTVGTDGKLRWQHTFAGARKGHAYSLEHRVHILSQSTDGRLTRVTGLDEVTGEQKFELTIPASSERLTSLQRAGMRLLCAPGSSTSPAPTIVSRLFVNIDGFAYLAFTQSERNLETAACAPGSPVEPRDVSVEQTERVVLWQIHPDGTYRSTIVEESRASRALSEPVTVASPTGGNITDGLGGVLLSIRRSHSADEEDAHRSADEFVCRLDSDGKVVYRLPLPKYAGPLHDEMVLGEGDVGFAARGGVLVAFNVREGTELWRWDSQLSGTGIKVYAALANGACLVQTPTAVVEVQNANSSREVFQGQVMMDWQGRMYQKNY